ncbi:nitrate reductase NapE component [Mucilaginibacter sp. SG564]|nr:nitrate reductase NapE component [Mucilaginibacter sp. SG564]
MSANRLRLIIWLVLSTVLYIILSIVHLTPDFSEWAAISRGIFVVGTLGFAIWVIVSPSDK